MTPVDDDDQMIMMKIRVYYLSCMKMQRNQVSMNSQKANKAVLVREARVMVYIKRLMALRILVVVRE